MGEALLAIGFMAFALGIAGLIHPRLLRRTSRGRAATVLFAGLAMVVAASPSGDAPADTGTLGQPVESAVSQGAEVQPVAGLAPAGLVASSSPTTRPTVGALEEAVVVSVTDGDTVKVRLPDGKVESVRLIGIDTPERGQPFFSESSRHLELLVLGRTVQMASDVTNRDRFGRLLRYLHVDGVDVNEAMVRDGMAVAYRYEPDTARAEVFEAAQAAALAAGAGRWADAPPATFAPVQPIAATPPAPATGSSCHPSYEGACVPAGVSDVDCAGGSGNGPYYTGRVRVVGPDVYRLDGDGDGIGCEGS